MKKFEFSLGHMLDYRDRILDEEQRVLQRFKGERDQIQRHIDLLQSEFESIAQEMQQAQENGVTAQEVRGYGAQLNNLRMQLKDLDRALQAAARKVDNQTKIVVAANQEVSKLDKLQDKQYEAYRKHAQKAEELQIEEFVLLGLSRKNAG